MNLARKIVIISITILSVFFVYTTKQNAMIDDFHNRAASTTMELSQTVQLSVGYLEFLKLYGNDFYMRDCRSKSRNFDFLKPLPDHSGYSMDTLSGTALENNMGNITSNGPYDADPKVYQNFDLALSYNPYFKTIYNNLPGVAWIYYTGKNEFINIFPFAPSKEYKFNTNLYSLPFYTVSTPENNPSRQLKWSPVYSDTAGKGLMVTLSQPIYDGDNFAGVVSLDYTLDTLQTMLNSKYKSFVVSEKDEILASNFGPHSKTKPLSTQELLNLRTSEEINLITSAQPSTVTVAGNHYVYNVNIENTSWQLIHLLSVHAVVFKSALYCVPILSIGLMLLLSNRAYEEKRMAESNLSHTVEQLEESKLLLEKAASIDFLTETLNRRSMTQRMNEEVFRTGRNHSAFSLIMGDIDHFKLFNDQYGHAAGDRILVELAKILNEHTRTSDLVSRWGGEEFLIVLPDTTYTSAMTTAEKLRQSVEKMELKWTEGMTLHLTMSFGVSEYENAIGLDRSILRADDALYFAKKAGRNRVSGYKDVSFIGI